MSTNQFSILKCLDLHENYLKTQLIRSLAVRNGSVSGVSTTTTFGIGIRLVYFSITYHSDLFLSFTGYKSNLPFLPHIRTLKILSGA